VTSFFILKLSCLMNGVLFYVSILDVVPLLEMKMSRTDTLNGRGRAVDLISAHQCRARVTSATALYNRRRAALAEVNGGKDVSRQRLIWWHGMAAA